MAKDDFPPGYVKPTMTQGSSGSPGQSSNNDINARQNQHAQMLKMTRGGSAGKIPAPEVPTPAGNGPGGPGQTPAHNNNNATTHAMQGQANRQYDTITGGSRRKR